MEWMEWYNIFFTVRGKERMKSTKHECSVGIGGGYLGYMKEYLYNGVISSYFFLFYSREK